MIDAVRISITADARIAAAMQAVRRDLRDVRGALATVGDYADRAGRAVRNIGLGMTATVTAPLIAGFSGVVSAAGDFEAAMNSVAALTGARGASFDALSEAARELGATTRNTATEAALGIEMLARNGLKVPDILGGALDATVKLAAAAGTELAPAADLATDAMAIFGKSAADLGAVVDTVAGTLVNSKFGFNDFALAVAQGGGVAAVAGLDLDEFAVSIAAISPLFKSGSDAGTSFKTFLQRLVPTTEEAQKEMTRLGLSFTDAQGNILPMAVVAERLRGALSGLTEEQRIAALTTIFGTDAMRAAAGMAQVGADGFLRLADAVSQVSASDLAAARMQGFSGQMAALRSSLEALSISIAQAGVLEFLTDLARRATDLVRSVSEANPALMRTGVVIAGVAAAVGPALAALGLMTMGVTALGGAVSGLVALLVANPIGLAVAAAAVGLTAVAATVAAFSEKTGGLAKAQADLDLATANLVIGLGDEITQSQLLQSALGQSNTMSVEAARAKLQEAVARHQNVSAIIAERRALALGSDAYSILTGRIEDARAAVEAVGFGATDRAAPGRADAFEAAQSRLAQLLVERQALLAVGEEESAQLKRTEANIEALTSALDRAQGGLVSFGNEVVVPVEVSERLSEALTSVGAGAGAAADGVGRLTRETVKARDAGKEMQEGFASAFSSIVRRASSVEDALGRLADRILDEHLQFLFNWGVDRLGLGGFFGGLLPQAGPVASAKGNAFSGGALVPFATGGIVSSPTLFPMSGARTGLMGEAGPEAIMPLSRGPDGRLGVRASGAGGGTSVNVEVHVHNVPADRRAEVRTSQDGRRIDVVLRDEVRDMIERGDLDGTMRRTFGVRRTAAAGL